jgi:hypothetical protein
MLVLDVLYVALSTILVMVVLQFATFFVTRMMHPPEPKIIYRDSPPQVIYREAPVQNGPVLTHPPPQEVKLPEYEPRNKQTTSELQLDAGLPDGLQETRPPGT